MFNIARTIDSEPLMHTFVQHDEHYVYHHLTRVSDNEYIPVRAIRSAIPIVDETNTEVDKVYCLTLNLRQRRVNMVRKLVDFAKALQRTYDSLSLLNYAPIRYRYVAAFGGLYYLSPDSPPVVMLELCVRKSALHKASYEKSDYCLLVNREFITDEEHFKLYRNIKKGYIDLAEAEGIDVLFTNNLVNLCYRQAPIIHYKFKTFDEIVNFSDTVKQELNDWLITRVY